MDITTFFGYKAQFVFYIENNGLNPVQVISIDLIEGSTLISNNIYFEMENTLPLSISGNSQIDVVNNFYSLNTNDFTNSVTFRVTVEVLDMSDLTSIIDTTITDLSFDLTNPYIGDESSYEMLRKLNKYYKLGPASSTDDTIRSSNLTATGLPIITFDNYSSYNLFSLRYRPQFLILNNSNLGLTVLVGHFYYNYETKSLEAYLTTDERSSVIGMSFNNIYLFYTDTITNDISLL